MKKSKPEMFFQNKNRQHHLLAATIIMFLCLSLETLFSAITAVYESGGTHLDFHMTPTKIISMIIYVAVALLLYKKVNYKLLLVPDFFLFGVKLYYIISGIYHLNALSTVGAYTSLSEWEHIIENALFCIFLLTLFACKLLPSKESMHLRLPYICLSALALCFPFTIVFEAIKAIDETILHALPLEASLFNFLIGVLSEAFLDLPYALLLMVVFFVPHNKKESSKTSEI